MSAIVHQTCDQERIPQAVIVENLDYRLICGVSKQGGVGP